MDIYQDSQVGWAKFRPMNFDLARTFTDMPTISISLPVNDGQNAGQHFSKIEYRGGILLTGRGMHKSTGRFLKNRPERLGGGGD
jgi:hypothetical protein